MMKRTSYRVLEEIVRQELKDFQIKKEIPGG